MKPQLSRENIHHYVLHPTIIWDLTTYCNFRCIYCYSDQMSNRLLKISERFSLDLIAEAFAEHLPNWVIVYTGGEPFVFKDFANLNLELIRNNYIGLYTNLSIAPEIRSFVQKVPPEHVTFINCGFHVAMRIKHDPNFTKFLRLYYMLVDNGFSAFVTYIMHPSVVSRAVDDIKRFADLGVKVWLKVFRGIYNGLSYPESYTPSVLKLIEENEPAIMRGHPVRSQMTGEGCLCRAGMLLLDMDVDGNVYRCLTNRSLQRDCLGNLFKGTLNIKKEPTMCRNEICLSARQGMGFSIKGIRDLHSPRPLAGWNDEFDLCKNKGAVL